MLKGYTVNFMILAAFLTIGGCESTYQDTYDLYKNYRLQSNNKAYAIGTNKIAGAAWGAQNTKEATKLAIQTCEELGGTNCNVVDINGSSITK